MRCSLLYTPTANLSKVHVLLHSLFTATENVVSPCHLVVIYRHDSLLYRLQFQQLLFQISCCPQGIWAMKYQPYSISKHGEEISNQTFIYHVQEGVYHTNVLLVRISPKQLHFDMDSTIPFYWWGFSHTVTVWYGFYQTIKIVRLFPYWLKNK